MGRLGRFVREFGVLPDCTGCVKQPFLVSLAPLTTGKFYGRLLVSSEIRVVRMPARSVGQPVLEEA